MKPIDRPGFLGMTNTTKNNDAYDEALARRATAQFVLETAAIAADKAEDVYVAARKVYALADDDVRRLAEDASWRVRHANR